MKGKRQKDMKQVILNKKQQNMLDNYNRAKWSTIEQAYKTCSNAKKDAFSDIWYEMRMRNGCDMRITSKCSNFFTCAYRYYDEAGRLRLCYHYPTRVEDFILFDND